MNGPRYYHTKQSKYKGKDKYHITYIMWNLKYGTHKLIYKQK